MFTVIFAYGNYCLMDASGEVALKSANRREAYFALAGIEDYIEEHRGDLGGMGHWQDWIREVL